MTKNLSDLSQTQFWLTSHAQRVTEQTGRNITRLDKGKSPDTFVDCQEWGLFLESRAFFSKLPHLPSSPIYGYDFHKENILNKRFAILGNQNKSFQLFCFPSKHVALQQERTINLYCDTVLDKSHSERYSLIVNSRWLTVFTVRVR